MKVVQKVTVVWTATLNVDQLERTRKMKVQKLQNLSSDSYISGKKERLIKGRFFIASILILIKVTPRTKSKKRETKRKARKKLNQERYIKRAPYS